MKTTRIVFAAVLSLLVLGGTWIVRAQDKDSFILHPVKFDGLGAQGTPQIPTGWKLVSAGSGRAPNETNLWFQDAAGSVYMVQGFKDPNSREFLVYHYVNQIEGEK